jgi:hypothetical protein
MGRCQKAGQNDQRLNVCDDRSNWNAFTIEID